MILQSPPTMGWGVEDKNKSSENMAIIKVKLYIDAKVVKEMRIATWMFPERGSEQERGGVDISCFRAKHMVFSENKVVPKPIVYHNFHLYYIIKLYVNNGKHWTFRSSLPLFFWLWKWYPWVSPSEKAFFCGHLK